MDIEDRDTSEIVLELRQQNRLKNKFLDLNTWGKLFTVEKIHEDQNQGRDLLRFGSMFLDIFFDVPSFLDVGCVISNTFFDLVGLVDLIDILR